MEAGKHRVFVQGDAQEGVLAHIVQLEGSSSRKTAVGQLCCSQTSHRDHLPAQNWCHLLKTGHSCLNISPFLRPDSHTSCWEPEQDQV